MTPCLSKKELEDYLDDTVSMIKEWDNHAMKMNGLLHILPDINDMVQESLKTQTILASAANSISSTLQKMEERQTKLEEINTALYGNKGIPPGLVLLILGSLLITIIMLVGSTTDSYVKGTVNSIEIGARERINKLSKEVK